MKPRPSKNLWGNFKNSIQGLDKKQKYGLWSLRKDFKTNLAGVGQIPLIPKKSLHKESLDGPTLNLVEYLNLLFCLLYLFWDFERTSWKVGSTWSCSSLELWYSNCCCWPYVEVSYSIWPWSKVQAFSRKTLFKLFSPKVVSSTSTDASTKDPPGKQIQQLQFKNCYLDYNL